MLTDNISFTFLRARTVSKWEHDIAHVVPGAVVEMNNIQQIAGHSGFINIGAN